MFQRPAPATLFAAIVLLGPLPYLTVRQLWTFDLADRIGCVVAVLFLLSLGIGTAIHAFRGKPLTEIGER